MLGIIRRLTLLFNASMPFCILCTILYKWFEGINELKTNKKGKQIRIITLIIPLINEIKTQNEKLYFVEKGIAKQCIF